MAVTAPDIETRVCRKCGQERPLTDFVKATKSRTGYLHTCKPCVNAYKRARDAELRGQGLQVSTSKERAARAAQRRRLGHEHVEHAPSSPELSMMGAFLAEDRRDGYDFDEIYADNVRVALSVLPDRDRAMAAAVLAWAEPHFRRGYQRQHVVGLDPGLLDAVTGRRGDIEFV